MNKLTTSFYNRFACIRLGLYLSALTLFCGWAQSAGAATLTTDRLDYPPFSDVTLTGTGFGPNDAVTVAISEVNADGSRTFVQQVAATADPAGSFTATWYIFSDEFGGALLEAIATGNPSGATATALFSDTGPGTPLLSPPTGGFGIDGDLYANTPTANRGDWAPATGGTGGNVLDASGNPLNGATTFHLTDPFASGTDNNFAGGNKVNDNPNTWTWVSNPVGDKVDINNALLHFTTDGAGDTWLVIAADRLSDNGDAYIDFEFLQNSLTVTTTPGSSPPAGGFVSAGLDGGRTVNDFILTVSLTKGGSMASFFVERWQAVGAGYNYVDYAPPVGDTFAAVNTAVVSSPYSAFGGSTYAKNTFAEAAVNLTKLIGSFNPCLSLGIKTVLVKTKVSQSPTAGMVDFISPLQVSLTLGVANAGHDQSKCSEGTSTSFALSGTATPSPGQTVSSTTWSVVPGTGTATIDTPGSLNTSVAVSSPSVTMRLTVATVQGCTATNDIVLTVLPTPTCSIIGETVLYAGTIGATYTAPADAGSYSWSLSGDAVDNGFLTDISGETSQTLSFNLAGGASGSFTVTLNRAGENGCISTCFKPVEIQPLEAGCLIDGPLTACAGQQNVEYNLHAVGSATSITWSLNPNTSGAVFDPTPAPMAETVFVDAGVAGSYTVNVTVIYPGGTLNCSRDTTVNPLPACSITGPVGPVCPNSSGNIYSVPEGPDGTLYAWTIDGGSIVGSSTGPSVSVTAGSTCGASFTLNVTVTFPSGCHTTCNKTVSVIDTTAPTPPAAPATVDYECEALVPPAQTLTATDNCGAIITGVPSDSRNGANPCHVIITRRWTFTDACGNSSFVEQTITVSDNTAPTPPAAPATVDYECEALVPPAQTLTATDNCGAIITGVPTDSRNGANPCHVIITRRWTFTDACGNSSFVEQTITVSDNTAPTPPAAPATVDYECEALVPPAQTLTATDNCGAIITGVPSDSRNGANPCHVIITRRWTFTDACGNSSFVEQTITVSDNTAPTPPAAPATVDYECEALVPPAQTLTATDNCGAIITGVPSDSRNGANPCHVIITRRWTFTDACGNSSFVEQTITVSDNTAPTPPAAPATVDYECEALVPPAQTLTATDNCGAIITGVPSDSRNGANPCHVIITRRWTFTDACGNSSFVEQTITVSDNTAPTPPAAPATVDYECEALVPPAQTLTATDNCGAIITGVPTDSRNGANPCHVIITRRWTFTDACGNSSFVEQTITVSDNTAPTPPAAPATVDYECEALVPPAQTLTATDNCGAIITGVPSDSRNAANPCHVIITRRWTFTDACGNSSFVEQTITVSDNMAPTPPAAPATVDYECEALVPQAQTLTATDNCGAIITGVPSDSRNGANPCHVIITRRWTFTDACGNSSFVEQTITVSDNTAPTPPAAPATVDYECEALVPPAQTLTATDNCGAIITGVPTDSRNGANPCHVIITRRWTFTDACGNSSFVEQTITVSDNTAPTPPAAPATMDYECEALVPPAQTLTATDNCGAIITGVPTDSRNGANPCHVIITRRWTFTDACGNSSFVEQIITVSDNTAPTPPAAPATVDYECEALVPPAQTLTATDNCGAIITGVPSDSRNGANPCHVIITRRWTFTDACGNSSFVEQTITVSDNTAPTPPAAPATVDYECEALVPPAQTLTATDNCGAIITGVPTDSRNGANPCHVIITRRWTFTDACGNSSFVEQTITVSDNTAPTPPAAPATVDYECEALVPAAQTLTATDNCGAIITGVPSDSRNGANPCHVIITRRWTFTDACGNSSFVEQTITVSDNTAPVLSGCPAVTTSRYQGLSEVPAAPAVTATDNCDSYVPVYFNETQSNPGSSCNNVIRRTWTATDRCGNPASCTQTITVNDTTNPVLSGYPAPTLYVQCVGEVPEPAYVTANDNCAGALTPDFTETSSGSACDKTITRTWTAQDACGNSASRSQVIHVKDTKAPVINCPKDYIANCGSGKCGTNPELTGKATATDNCDGDVTATYTDSGTPDTNSCEWTIYRTWTAKDACGNTSTCVQKIMCVPYSKAIVTDSSLCSYDWDLSTTCREFRLLFTPYGSGYKLNASNPGQTYYNVFYVAPVGTPAGTPITLTLTIPYPYVTQGANPIHAYDDVDVTGSYPTLCLVNLGNPVPITSVTPAPLITLETYGRPPAGQTTMTVTVPLPASGFIYLNMHLDYGLKGTYGYSKAGPSGNDAVSQTTGKVVIPDKTNYVFSVGGAITDADGICNMNVFKKNPGVGGRCGYRYTLDGVSDIIATPNATVTLKDSKGAVLTTGKTDEDGWYMLSYKWTGKAATLIVTVQPVGKPAQSKSITLKANGFVEVNFDVP